MMKCTHCQADLTTLKSVQRTYASKSDIHGDAHGLGHYLPDGTFEPDHAAYLGGGNYDLLDNSDRCARCDGQP